MTRHTPSYRTVRKRDVWAMRQIGRVWPRFVSVYYTAWRWPFRRAVVYLPDTMSAFRGVAMQHEEHHVRQFAPWYGPAVIVAYLVVPWVRWLVERRAYLIDIRAGAATPAAVADRIADEYWVLLPRSYMRRWLTQNAHKGGPF